MDNNLPHLEENEKNDIVCGRNPVMEVLRSGREIDKLFIIRGAAGGTVSAIIAKCKARDIPIKEISPQKMDFLCGNLNHQGVAVSCAAHSYSTVEEIFNYANEKEEKPFIIICDEITDTHNLGAIIRTAEACSAHGIIIPKRRSASLNATVEKTSAGALEFMRVARVTNLSSTIDYLKERGVWVYGADMDGSDYRTVDYDCPLALVIGSEGKGIGTLISKKCDGIISLPMRGKINSLNASVAAGILMYAAANGRDKQIGKECKQ